jgi:hypothetical protein
MNMDNLVYAVLADPKNKLILHKIGSNKTAQLRELVDNEISRQDVLNAVIALKKANLIKEDPSPLDDLKTYFITATGLQADRATAKS